MNASRHATLVHAANCITHHSDLLHMVENFKIACAMSWQLSKISWKKIGQDIGFICLKLVDGSVDRNIVAEGANTRQSYLIYITDDGTTDGSGTGRPQCF